MITELTTKRFVRAVALVCVFGACTGRVAYAQRSIGGCPVLPANNIWNTPVDTLPVLANSASMVTTIGAARDSMPTSARASGTAARSAFRSSPCRERRRSIRRRSSMRTKATPGPYAVPLNAPIEGGSSSTGDRHAIALDTDNCILYELYRAFPQSSSWTARFGAIFDLRSNALRPSTWTSADAAGLPIVPGLVTYDEVLSGEIRHAIRFTAPQTRREFVWPARHYASSLTGTQYPRMGERFRLKASFNITPYPADVQVILRAMKKYGIILADNGSAWYISGGRTRAGTTTTCTRSVSCSARTSKRWTRRCSESIRTPARRSRTASRSRSARPRPRSASARSQTFAATVTGAPNTVIWSVNDIPGGDTVVGMIDASGQYIGSRRCADSRGRDRARHEHGVPDIDRQRRR